MNNLQTKYNYNNFKEKLKLNDYVLFTKSLYVENEYLFFQLYDKNKIYIVNNHAKSPVKNLPILLLKS